MSERTDFVDAEVRRRIEEQKSQTEIELRLDMIKAYGEDVYDDGACFVFTKRFVLGGTAYTYAVIKATNGLWYTTGRMQYGVDWVQLATWLVSGKDPVEFKDLIEMVPRELVRED